MFPWNGFSFKEALNKHDDVKVVFTLKNDTYYVVDLKTSKILEIKGNNIYRKIKSKWDMTEVRDQTTIGLFERDAFLVYYDNNRGLFYD
jgi:hypothetical protein